MTKDIYDRMNCSELRQLYVERVGYLGIENPQVPRTKRGLVTMLRAADSLGVPQDRDTDPMDSIRNAVVKILKEGIAESKRTGKSLPYIIIS